MPAGGTTAPPGRLSDYTRALEDAGFVIEALREPQPAPEAPPRFADERRIPMFLMLRALRPDAGPGHR